MPGSERRKQVERERYQRQVSRRIRRDERNRTIRAVVISVLVVVVIVGGMGFLAYTLSDPDSDPAAMPTKTPTRKQSPPASEKPSGCTYQEVPSQKGLLKDVGTPPAKPKKQKYEATIATNRGDIGVSLLGKQAPCTVNSFRYLTGKGFFDSTKCHRVVNKKIYVLQCGKPAGKAQGPTYQFASENTKGAKYSRGTLAMANGGTPNSNGSQFFIVYKNSPLPPQYTVFGQVTKGMDMVEKVGKAGATKEDPRVGGGPPKKKVKIEKVSVSPA